MPFAAHTTTSAGWKCSCPLASSHVAPRARPRPSTSIRRTRAPVTRCAPAAIGARPVRDVGRTLGALVAPRTARPALHARVASVVLGRQDRVVLGPPVPPESCVCAREREPGASDRQRRKRRIDAGRVHRVAAQPGDPELPVGLLVVGCELGVRQGPVVGDAVLGAGAEVRREEAGPHRAVEHGAAADAVEIAEHHVGVVEVDRVVGRQVADVGRRRPLLAGLELPVGPGAGIAAGILPVALLQTHHAHAGAGEPHGGDAARRAGAEDQDVGVISHSRSAPRAGRPGPAS